MIIWPAFFAAAAVPVAVLPGPVAVVLVVSFAAAAISKHAAAVVQPVD